MNRYRIFETHDSGIYERGGVNYVRIRIYDEIDEANSSPSSVQITVTGPCGEAIACAPMVEESTGVYYYEQAIAVDAPYGKYSITISTATYTQETKFDYYIMPWNINTEVRRLSGIGQNKSIADNALNQLIWDSYSEALHSVFIHHKNEKPRCNCEFEDCKCSTIVCDDFDGTNTTFWTKSPYIADYNGDGSTSGYGELSCGTDVFVRWKDCDGNCYDGWAEVLDADCGKLKITQDGTTPIPADYAWVHLEYWTKSRKFTDELFRQAVTYLAAHKVLLRFGELERATSADLNAAQNIKYVDPQRMYKAYRKVLKKIRDPVVGGAITNQ